MGKLQIANVRRMPALADRNDMINCWRERMRILVTKVDRLATYPAHCLCLEYLLPGGFKRCAIARSPV